MLNLIREMLVDISCEIFEPVVAIAARKSQPVEATAWDEHLQPVPRCVGLIHNYRAVDSPPDFEFMICVRNFNGKPTIQNGGNRCGSVW